MGMQGKVEELGAEGKGLRNKGNGYVGYRYKTQKINACCYSYNGKDRVLL